jgi:uncharacterized SAM-binding protein YcdF (DUF218 family)
MSGDQKEAISRCAWRRVAHTVTAGLLVCGLSVPFAGRALVLSRPLPAPDAIVSLASHEWERLPLATRLAVKHPNALVLLTLPEDVNTYNCYDCARRVEHLVAAGVPARRIRVLRPSKGGTYAEAEACRVFASEVPIRRLLIVTSPYHTRRALAVFRTVLSASGIQVGVEPATADSQARPERWWLSSYDRWYVRYEWAATAYYAIRYGILPFSWWTSHEGVADSDD